MPAVARSLRLARGAESSLRRRLLAWYRRHRRDLPWRRTADPYAVWVSEVMLQQTTVAAATPFFERWMARFPTVAALAQAREEQVLAFWAGLGYYNRARNLHRAARLVVERHGGAIPSDPETLRTLPGVGRYTAGAIASIAFGKRVPVVDANVARVLARIFAVRLDVTSAAGQRALWDLAEELVQTSAPGDLNQAVMELGALICTPVAPRCPACPARPLCRAARRGDPARFPVARARPATVEVTEVGAVIERDGRCLLLRRPGRGRLAGLWEFPHAPVADGDPGAAVAERMRELTGLEIALSEPLVTVEHPFTHHRITLHVWRAHAVGGRVRHPQHAEHRWIAPARLNRRPMATPMRRVAEALLATAGGRQLDLLTTSG